MEDISFELWERYRENIKMEDTPFEVWANYVDELLDKKLETFRTELRRLDKKVTQSLQTMVHAEIIRIANDCSEVVRSNKPKTPSIFYEQLNAKTRLVLKEADKSADPIQVMAEFHDWCLKEQNKLGVKFTRSLD